MSGQHILIALVAVMTFFASCNRDEAEVIPRKKLARIYAEMLLTDQWINSTPGVRLIADTSLVYEPILEKYGYDSEDYRKSLDVYMDNPERFAKVLGMTKVILGKRITELVEEQTRIALMARLPKIKVNFKIEEFTTYLTTEPYVHYFDSLDVKVDSATLLYKFISIERSDTLYDGLRMVFKDSLAVADTLQPVDSIKAEPLDAELVRKNMPVKRDFVDKEPLKARDRDIRPPSFVLRNQIKSVADSLIIKDK